MQENEFEKEVRAAMDGLRLKPSDTLWPAVEAQIRQRRKRRAILFFWVLAVSIVTAGLSVAILQPKTSTPVIASSKKSLANEPVPLKPEAVNDTHLAQKELKDEPAPNQLNSASVPASIPAAKRTYPVAGAEAENGESTTAYLEPLANIHLKQAKSDIASEGSVIESSKVARKRSKRSMIAGKASMSFMENSSNEVPQDVSLVEACTDRALSTAVVAPMLMQTRMAPKPDATIIGVNTSVTSFKKIHAKKMSSPKTTWSLEVGGGLSSISQSVPKAAPLAFLSAPTIAVPVGVSFISFSDPVSKHGETFEAALSMQRDLSRRFFFRAGLGYQYFSTRINAAQEVNNSSPNFQLTGAYRLANYYNVATTPTYHFKNAFHFVTSSISVGVHLNKHFSLEGGVEPSLLVQSNVLHFDKLNRVYLKNDEILNKLQLPVFSTFRYHLKLQNGYDLSFGPSFSYGLSNMVQRSFNGSNHSRAGEFKVAITRNTRK
jgi:hypothetical protein